MSKLIVEMIEHCSDLNSSIRWKAPKVSVVDWKGMPMHEYELMSSALDILSIDHLQEAASKIRELEIGAVFKESVGLDDRASLMTPEKVTFWFEHGAEDGGEIKGGDVKLSQFKLAVQTLIQFLGDPEHKAIEVELPEK